MILCVYGFPTNVSALQFEWAWQHPKTSLAVRTAAASFKSLNGVANLIKLAYTMLTLPPWQSLKLTVNFFSTKHTTLSAGCPSLPKQMKVQVCPMDELPCYIEGYQVLEEDEYDEDNEVNENENGDENVREGLMDISDYNSVEYHCGNVETAHDLQRWTEDDDLIRWPRDPPTPSEDFRESSFSTIDSYWGTQCTSIPSFGYTQEVEDKDLFGLIEASSRKLGQSTEQFLGPPLVDNNNGQRPSSDTLIVSPEVGFRFRQPRDSFPREEEEHRGPPSLFDSAKETPPSSSTGLVNIVDRVDNRDSAGSIEECSNKLEQTSKQQLAANNHQLPSTSRFHFSPEVEVINLLTPSSDCMIYSLHKRKKPSRVCQKNIIDLTRSPIFVQL